jgi:hypothetical protein
MEALRASGLPGDDIPMIAAVDSSDIDRIVRLERQVERR